MKQGFTLVELLVVVLIIGILAAMAMPHYEKAVWEARASQLFVSVRSLANAQENFFLKIFILAAYKFFFVRVNESKKIIFNKMRVFKSNR